MQPETSAMQRVLVMQLARVGDVIQSLPAIEAVRGSRPDQLVDVLCAAPFAPMLAGSAAVNRVIPWDGSRWRGWAEQWPQDPTQVVEAVQTCVESLGQASYELVYRLNQHERSRLMAQLFRSAASEAAIATMEQTFNVWSDYLRQVARERGENRVHLADAWCGMCGVRPLGTVPRLTHSMTDLPAHLQPIGAAEGCWVAVVVGAGDSERCVPPSVWTEWIQAFLAQVDEGRVVLVGGEHEREVGRTIMGDLPSLLQGRTWDVTGRTPLKDLPALLGRCRWVVGSDTGPLHMATIVGCRAVGWYFAQARVHETGPYGNEHYVFQHVNTDRPTNWPIQETVQMLRGEQVTDVEYWQGWNSHMDHWGVYYSEHATKFPEPRRAAVWRRLAPMLCETAAA